MAQLVKNLPAMPETWVQSLGWEDSLEKGKTTHSRIPWTMYSPWGHKESDMTERLSLFTPRAEGIQFGNEWRCSSLKWNLPGFCIYLDGPQWPAPSVCKTAAPGRLHGIYWRWRRAPGLPRSWWIKPVSFRGSCATPVSCSSLNPPALPKSFTPMGTFEFDKWHCLPGDRMRAIRFLFKPSTSAATRHVLEQTATPGAWQNTQEMGRTGNGGSQGCPEAYANHSSSL